MKERSPGMHRHRSEVEVRNTPYRSEVLSRLLAGHSMKRISVAMQKEPKTISELCSQMVREANVTPTRIHSFLIDWVLSQPDPAGFVRAARDPSGYDLFFNESRLHDAFMTKKRRMQFYEYRDRRLGINGIEQKMDWKGLAWSFNNGHFAGYISDQEVSALRIFGETKDLGEVAQIMGAPLQTVKSHYLHDASLKLGISVGSRLTTMQTWLESLALGIVKPVQPSVQINML